MSKMSAKLQWGHLQQGRQIQVNRLNSTIFDQYFVIFPKRCKIGS